MEGEVEVIAGEREMRVRRVALAHRDEPERLPEGLSGGKVGRRQAHLGEIPAQRDFGVGPRDRRVGARLEYRHRVAEGIGKTDLVEDLFARAADGELDAERGVRRYVLSDPRVHEGEVGGRYDPLVQS